MRYGDVKGEWGRVDAVRGSSAGKCYGDEVEGCGVDTQ